MGSLSETPAVLLALAILFAIIWIASPSFAAAAPEKTVRATILYKDAADYAKATVTVKRLASEDISAKALRAGGKIRHKFAAINAVSAEFTESELSEIERDPRIIVERSKPVRAFLQESVPLIRANDTWARKVSGQSITGAGTSVCVIDTGVDYTHPDLGNCTIRNRTVSGQIENYPLESPHPYSDNNTTLWKINKTGYTNIAVHFSTINVEPHFDYVRIYDVNNNSIKNYTGEHQDVWTPSVAGDTIYASLSSDALINAYGFSIDNVINGTVNDIYNWSSCRKVLNGTDIINEDEDPFDDVGHGTHVAGIIAANGSIKGVAPDAKLLAVKALNSDGGGADDIAAGIEWCISNVAQYNVTAISVSLGTAYYRSSSLCDADFPVMSALINNAVAKNISVVVATGNDGRNTSIASPACIQNATRVGSVDDGSLGSTADQISGFTNRGSGFPDMLLAPGRWITSTVPTGSCEFCNPSGYDTFSGTSMSTPHVSGAIALLSQAYKTKHGGFPAPSFLWSALNMTGERIHDSQTGLNFPRIDVLAALNSFIAPNITLAYNNVTNNDSAIFTINETASVFFNISLDQPASFSWYINSTLQNSTSNNFTWITDYASAGAWMVRVVASNGYLNNLFQWNVTLFDSPLKIISFYPPENFTAEENFATAFNVTTSHNTTQDTWRLDGTVFLVESRNATISWNCSSAGMHNISYTGSDGFDTVVQNWTANITGISCPQIEVFAKNYTTDDFIFVNATISEAPNSCILTFNGADYAMSRNDAYCAYNVTSLAPATYNFSVLANDSAGNWNRIGNFSVQVFYCFESYGDWSGCMSGERERSHTLRDCSVVSEQESCQSQPAGGSGGGGYGDSIPQKNNTNNTASAGNNTFLNASLAILNGTGNTKESVLHLNISGENIQDKTAPVGESPKEVSGRAEGRITAAISGIFREARARIFSGSILDAGRASGRSSSILDSISSSITVAGKIASGAVRTLFGWIFNPFI